MIKFKQVVDHLFKRFEWSCYVWPPYQLYYGKYLKKQLVGRYSTLEAAEYARSLDLKFNPGRLMNLYSIHKSTADHA